jgi:hypothetical protein
VPAQPATEFNVVPASVDQFRGDSPETMSVFRLTENPNVVLLDFASLEQQGRMLDRVAALTEKKSLPRDRILTPDQLLRAVHSDANPEPWFYYGHDYSAAELNHFFDVAARDNVSLTPEEAQLGRLLTQLGWRGATTPGALISVPRVGADQNVTAEARNTILTHELSHGEYFSNPVYADYVHAFWETALSAPERDAVRSFLAREGYDRDSAEIMENEAQAYLMFTADPNFFTPHDVGMAPERRAELRAQFLRAMPPGWLKDVLARLP